MRLHPKLIVQKMRFIIIELIVLHKSLDCVFRQSPQCFARLRERVPTHEQEPEQLRFFLSQADIVHVIKARDLVISRSGPQKFREALHRERYQRPPEVFHVLKR